MFVFRKQYVSMYEPQQNPDTFLDDFEYSAEQIRNMVNNGLDIDIARLFPNFDEEAVSWKSYLATYKYKYA